VNALCLMNINTCHDRGRASALDTVRTLQGVEDLGRKLSASCMFRPIVGSDESCDRAAKSVDS